jgi:hypothetical protein
MNYRRGSAHYRYRHGGLYFDGSRWRVSSRDGSTVTWARVVIWDALGREPLPSEHVHHVNRDRTDDRRENLELVDIREHARIHAGEGARARAANQRYEWSNHAPACVVCGTDERPHFAKGSCGRCYSREYMRARRAAA